MALPAHYGTGTPVDGGVEYRRDDPRAPGYSGVVFHQTTPGLVMYQLRSPRGCTGWIAVRDVPSGLAKVANHVSNAVVAQVTEAARRSARLRKYPTDCARCGARPGEQCVSSSGNPSGMHAARRLRD